MNLTKTTLLMTTTRKTLRAAGTMLIAAVLATTCMTGPLWADDDEHEHEHEHFDIAPHLVGGELLIGGLAHDGHAFAPPIGAFGYEFGEDPFDPYNAGDPGVNQAIGVGNLPVGAALGYNIMNDLLYWDGTDDPEFGAPPGETYITLLINTDFRTLDADSGPQAGAHIQSVSPAGTVHDHFITSLYNAPGHGNKPGIGDATYQQPPDGIYAFSLELTLNDSGTVYTSAPFWIVMNNGLNEHEHHEAMEAIPEPASLGLMAAGLALVSALRRRKRKGT